MLPDIKRPSTLSFNDFGGASFYEGNCDEDTIGHSRILAGLFIHGVALNVLIRDKSPLLTYRLCVSSPSFFSFLRDSCSSRSFSVMLFLGRAFFRRRSKSLTERFLD